MIRLPCSAIFYASIEGNVQAELHSRGIYTYNKVQGRYLDLWNTLHSSGIAFHTFLSNIPGSSMPSIHDSFAVLRDRILTSFRLIKHAAVLEDLPVCTWRIGEVTERRELEQSQHWTKAVLHGQDSKVGFDHSGKIGTSKVKSSLTRLDCEVGLKDDNRLRKPSFQGKITKSVKSKQQQGNHDLPREIGTLSIGGGRIMLFYRISNPEF